MSFSVILPIENYRGDNVSGMDEFIKLFGHITVGNIITLTLACVFLYKIYTKIRDFFVNKAEDDMHHKQEILDMIDAVKELTKDRTEMINNQKAMQTQLVQLCSAQQANSERLTQLETNINKRECNKLRDRILQSYRYYTSSQHNPLQQWTKMEAAAFWSLFDDYEAVDGNGYVHSVVQPSMQSLEVIEMDDADNIAHLMANRK
nr:MAG TPA: hypothetical protein [Caudoviricetes sp.]